MKEEECGSENHRGISMKKQKGFKNRQLFCDSGGMLEKDRRLSHNNHQKETSDENQVNLALKSTSNAHNPSIV
jgi:hypothetical protein